MLVGLNLFEFCRTSSPESQGYDSVSLIHYLSMFFVLYASNEKGEAIHWTFHVHISLTVKSLFNIAWPLNFNICMHNVDCTIEISPKKLILMRLGDQHGWCFGEIETAKCSPFSLIKFLKGAHWNFNLISSFHAVNKSFSSYAFGFKMKFLARDDYAVSNKPAEGLNSIIMVKLLNFLSIKSLTV